MVVGEVADYREPGVHLVESDDPRAGTHPRVAGERAPLTDWRTKLAVPASRRRR